MEKPTIKGGKIGPSSCFTLRNKKSSNGSVKNVVREEGVILQPLAEKLKGGDEFYKKLDTTDILLVTTGTGSGKTVCIPSYCLQYLFDKEYQGKVVLCQPKRLLVTSSSGTLTKINEDRMVKGVLTPDKDEDQDESKEQREKNDARLHVNVLQSMINKIAKDPLLLGHKPEEKISIVIVDESHERSVSTDILFSLLKTISIERKKRNDFFRVVFMSASMDLTRIEEYFFRDGMSTDKIEFELPSQYEVTIRYIDPDYEPWLPIDMSSPINTNQLSNNYERWMEKENKMKEFDDSPKNYLKLCWLLVTKIIKYEWEQQRRGSIIVFLPGESAIVDLRKMLNDYQDKKDAPGWLIFQISGNTKKEDREEKALNPDGRDWGIIYLSTDAAESSVTFNGLKYVIDTGIRLSVKYDSETNTSSLIPTYITQSSAKQRKGRVGRTSTGTVYRLYSEQRYNSMLPNGVIGIYTDNIDEDMLKIFNLQDKFMKKGIDIGSPYNFDFMDSPTLKEINNSVNRLILFGLVNNDFKLTELGEEYLKPRIVEIQTSGIPESLFNLYSNDKNISSSVKDSLYILCEGFTHEDVCRWFSIYELYNFYGEEEYAYKLSKILGDFGCYLALRTLNFNMHEEFDISIYLYNKYESKLNQDLSQKSIDEYLKDKFKTIEMTKLTDQEIGELKDIIKDILKHNKATKNTITRNWIKSVDKGGGGLLKQTNSLQNCYNILGKKNVGVNGYYDMSEQRYISFWRILEEGSQRTPYDRIKLSYDVPLDSSESPEKVLYLSCHNHSLQWVIPVDEFQNTDVDNVFNTLSDQDM